MGVTSVELLFSFSGMIGTGVTFGIGVTGVKGVTISFIFWIVTLELDDMGVTSVELLFSFSGMIGTGVTFGIGVTGVTISLISWIVTLELDDTVSFGFFVVTLCNGVIVTFLFFNCDKSGSVTDFSAGVTPKNGRVTLGFCTISPTVARLRVTVKPHDFNCLILSMNSSFSRTRLWEISFSLILVFVDFWTIFFFTFVMVIPVTGLLVTVARGGSVTVVTLAIDILFCSIAGMYFCDTL